MFDCFAGKLGVMLVLFSSLSSGWFLVKGLSINFKNCLPTSVTTVALKGGLNHVMSLDFFLPLLLQFAADACSSYVNVC